MSMLDEVWDVWLCWRRCVTGLHFEISKTNANSSVFSWPGVVSPDVSSQLHSSIVPTYLQL